MELSTTGSVSLSGTGRARPWWPGTTVPGVWGGGEVRDLGWWLVGKGMATRAADVVAIIVIYDS